MLAKPACKLVPMNITERMTQLVLARRPDIGVRGVKREIAKTCGISYEAVRQWFAGDTGNIKNEHLLAIAEGFDTTVDWLLSGKGEPPKRPAPSNVEPAFQPSRKPKDYPLISWVTAGAWAEAPDNFHPGSADEWISSTENAGDHGFWLTVRGDSMTCNGNPTFPDGSLILVKPEADRISGKYYVVKLLDSGEQTFKQYVEDSGHKYLRPLNPSYRTMEINGNCHFIGRVIDTKMTGL